ncbi:MAG: MarR family transcriptional regulator [Phycisphaerales bacterium]|jgi:DNA-binding MarR family transcriptional regulator
MTNTTPQAEVSDQDRTLARAYEGCLASAVRQADRVIASVFDERLREVGLRGTQLTLLGAVASLDRPNQCELAEATFTDPTTLSRNLDRLLERGLIDRIECKKDRRMRRYRLTDAGRQMLQDALPLWKAAQDEVSRRLGAELCAVLCGVSGALASG